MRWRLVPALALLCACTSPSRDGTGDPSIALVGVTIVDVERGRMLPDHTVLIAGDRIRSVGARAQVQIPPAATVVDGQGRYAIPGLWDMHIHVAMLEPEALALFVAHGVTGARDAGTDDRIYRWRDEVRRGARLGPRLVVAGRMIVESAQAEPFPGAHGVDTPAAAQEAVRQRRREGADYLKVQDSFMRRELWLALAQEAAAQNLAVVGHPPVDMPLLEAIEHGLRGIEHTLGFPLALSTAEAALRRRVMAADGEMARWTAGMAADVEALATLDAARLDGLAARMRDAGVVLDPNLTDSRAMATLASGRWNDDPRLAFLQPAVVKRWRESTSAGYFSPANSVNLQRLYERMPAVVRALHERGVTIVAGTDAGANFDFPGSDLHSELWHLVQAGLPPIDALRAATVNAAKAAGLGDSVGSIQPGKLADLVVLEANPLDDIRNTERIVAVVANGRYVDRQSLDEIFRKAQTVARAQE